MLNFQPEQDVRPTFETPIAHFRLPDAQQLNRGLRRIIRAKESSGPGIVRSNVGGWHSEDDFLVWPEPEVATFKEAIREAVGSLTGYLAKAARFEGSIKLQAWANVLRRSHYHRIHNHPNHTWSGVYYVDAGSDVADRPDSGQIEFRDPRGFIEMLPCTGLNFGDPITIKPESGLMLVWPAWLYHSVNPYHGKGERITIAFNARIENFRAL